MFIAQNNQTGSSPVTALTRSQGPALSFGLATAPEAPDTFHHSASMDPYVPLTHKRTSAMQLDSPFTLTNASQSKSSSRSSEASPGAEATIYPGAKILKQAIPFISKPNEVTATLMTTAGEVENIWEPGAVHEYYPGDVLMHYGKQIINGVEKDDYAVCTPDIFATSYTDAQGDYLNQGTEEHPCVALTPGMPTRAIKRAKGSALQVPPGTKMHTLETLKGDEPPVEIQKGQIVVTDHRGNPYEQSIAILLKKNRPVPGDHASESFFRTLAASVE